MEENRGFWGQLWMAELTLLHIMISVRCEIPLAMVEKLKGIVHPKSCGGIINWYLRHANKIFDAFATVAMLLKIKFLIIGAVYDFNIATLLSLLV